MLSQEEEIYFFSKSFRSETISFSLISSFSFFLEKLIWFEYKKNCGAKRLTIISSHDFSFSDFSREHFTFSQMDCISFASHKKKLSSSCLFSLYPIIPIPSSKNLQVTVLIL